jgi:hypothetical protein
MESAPRRQTRLIAMWLLIVAALLLSIGSLSRSPENQQLEKLKKLEDRIGQLDADLSKHAAQLESKNSN